MALFVKKEDSTSMIPLYNVGMNKTILVVGLGNVGKEYHNTRHNIGFACLDYFATQNDFPGWTQKKDLKCQLTSTNISDTRVILIKPTTFMNNSGEAVQAVQTFYKLPVDRTVIVHDELDIPFGQIRSRIGGGSAGHNGLKSVIEHGGENSGRIRIGIQNSFSQKADSADFVLGSFTKDEQAHLPAITKEVNALITEYIYSGALTNDTRTVVDA